MVLLWQVLLAKNFGIKRLVNLTNIDYVYDKDPRKFKDAKKFEKISWDEYKSLIGKKWIPGTHCPFDPVAAKMAAGLDIKVIYMDGRDFENVGRVLDGKKFIGTIIG